jgi:hypothetical protein
MTEAEERAWEEIERKQKLQDIKITDDLFDAVLAAQNFIEHTTKEDLAIMTLRKAYELGFRRGRA